MARIFTISFAIENRVCNAMISVQTTPFHTEYHVSMVDEDCRPELLSDTIVSGSDGHYAFHNAAPEKYTPLMKEILKAVSAHIHFKQV